MQLKQRPILALALRCAGMLLVSMMAVLVKRAGESGIALPEIIFWRQFITLPLIAGLLAYQGRLHLLRTERPWMHARRSTAGMMTMGCNFGALMLLPLAEATVLSFTSPLFAVLIAALALHHFVGPWRWLAVALGFAGVVIVANPAYQPISLLGAAIAVSGGLISAIVNFQIRDLARSEPSVSIVFYFALFGAAMMLPLLPFFMTRHDPAQWLMLLSIGLLGTSAQFLITAAVRFGAVASVLVMDYSSLIWAALFGWLVWDRLPSAATWIGAPLIVCAGLLIAWREHRRFQMPATAAQED